MNTIPYRPLCTGSRPDRGIAAYPLASALPHWSVIRRLPHRDPDKPPDYRLRFGVLYLAFQ